MEKIDDDPIYVQIAKKIIAVPDNKPEHAADHKLKTVSEIVENAMRMAERNALRKSTPSPVEGEKEEPNDKIINFLLGHGDYNGVWFGESSTYPERNFWWRTPLRQFVEAQASRIKALEREAKDDNYVISILTEQVKALEEQLAFEIRN